MDKIVSLDYQELMLVGGGEKEKPYFEVKTQLKPEETIKKFVSIDVEVAPETVIKKPATIELQLPPEAKIE